MSNRRHRHPYAPWCEITPNGMRDENGVITNGSHVYHPTKGWRRIPRDPRAGRLKIAALFIRAGVGLWL